MIGHAGLDNITLYNGRKTECIVQDGMDNTVYQQKSSLEFQGL